MQSWTWYEGGLPTDLTWDEYYITNATFKANIRAGRNRITVKAGSENVANETVTTMFDGEMVCGTTPESDHVVDPVKLFVIVVKEFLK